MKFWQRIADMFGVRIILYRGYCHDCNKVGPWMPTRAASCVWAWFQRDHRVFQEMERSLKGETE